MTQCAVVIDLGESQVLERHVPQPHEGRVDFSFPATHLLKQPAELLASPRFTEMLREAAGEYDRVVIDTAPVLAVSDTVDIAVTAAFTGTAPTASLASINIERVL